MAISGPTTLVKLEIVQGSEVWIVRDHEDDFVNSVQEHGLLTPRAPFFSLTPSFFMGAHLFPF